MIWQNIQYDLLEILGEGGQGTVYKALRRDRQTGLSDIVALKILHSETAVDLWKREFASLRRVRSPHCVQVLAFDRVRGRPALVLEFVDGLSLLELMKHGQLIDADVEEIMAQLEVALDDLRSFQSFHGDLSPANVMIDRQGQIKLLDFGLANLGGKNARLTPDFAAPERLAGAEPSLQCDLYSLGCVESFLRGRRSVSSMAYLAESPEDRRLVGRASFENTRRDLGFRIAQRMDQRRWDLTAQTKTQNVDRRAPRVNRWVAALAGIFLLSTASAEGTHHRNQLIAGLLVRTVKWHQIFINGQTVGYAPLSIPLPADVDVEITWNSAEGHGRKVLRAKAGQRIVMGDREFTP
jgi:serine/threonine protein kinase